MIIRLETQDDIAAVRAVVTEAFGQVAEADLVDSLRNSGDSIISLVAEEQGAIVGHILFSKLQTPSQCLALAPVSVAPGHQKQGVGSRLIKDGLARAKDDHWQAVFLLGDPDYYTQFGFDVKAAEKFETDYPKPYFMALDLAPKALAERAGTVIYAEPFLALG